MYQFQLKPVTRGWSPAAELEKEFSKLFEHTTKENYFTPACDIVDEEKFYAISLDVPGLRHEDLDIEIKDNQLFITGERKASQTNLVRSEKRYGKLYRAFTLPQNVNAEKIEAKFENGVLEITVPKEEKALSKKITIS